MNIVSSMANSCNVYYYILGSHLGIDKLHYYARAFSLGRLTGIDLPNERTGLFPSREWKQAQLREPWYPGDTVNTSIGQGNVTTTPLQVAVMISSIFNGGTVFVPHIVKAIEDPFTGERTYTEPRISGHLPISKEVRDIVMAGLAGAVEGIGGTSWRARVSGLRLGGKTGTSQVADLRHTENMREEDIPEEWRAHSWFGAIFPVENPRYTVVVVIEHGGSGGRGAAPVAGAIMNKMMELGYVGRH
jgi:penicillin-binding protein 2